MRQKQRPCCEDCGAPLGGHRSGGYDRLGTGAIYYSPLPGLTLRAALAGGFVVATILAFLLLPRRRRTLVGFFVVFAVLVALWFQIPASNDRDWQPEVAKTPWAEIDGRRRLMGIA